MKTIFVHHVFFWLRDPNNEQDKKDLIAGLNKIACLPVIRSFHIGQPAATNREVIDTSYSLSWLLIFDNKEDQELYQNDPLHLQFVTTCSHLWKKVVVYDSVDL
ncbi:MAG: Dabb family protein [Terrimonas sp.]|nr:Dabb family protein [Terrimonas sp.]